MYTRENEESSSDKITSNDVKVLPDKEDGNMENTLVFQGMATTIYLHGLVSLQI